MKNITMLIIVFLISTGITHADVGTFDIIEIEIDGKTFYTSQHAFGHYSHDTFSNKSCSNIRFEIMSDSIMLWSKYTKIYTSKLGMAESPIHLLDNVVKFHKDDIIGNFQIKKVTMGNSAGFIYSAGLNELDSIWINDYEIEKIFYLSDNEMCSMEFFAIKGNLDDNEKKALKRKLEKILLNYEEFGKVLDELYLQNIIMVGFCSC